MSLAMSLSGKTFLTLLALQSLNIVFVCFAMPHEVFYPTEALPALCALVTLFPTGSLPCRITSALRVLNMACLLHCVCVGMTTTQT